MTSLKAGTTATTILSKIPRKKKISNKQLNFCEENISLDGIIKSINSQRNNKSLGNDAFTRKCLWHHGCYLYN